MIGGYFLQLFIQTAQSRINENVRCQNHNARSQVEEDLLPSNFLANFRLAIN
jgi:hypothetical protein